MMLENQGENGNTGTTSIYFDIDVRGDALEMLMSGVLSVENCLEIKRSLVDALERSDHLLLSVAEDVEVDITFLQILCAAHHFALKSNKSFVLNGCPKVLSCAIEDAGYPRFRGCVHDRDRTCLWNMADS